MKPRNLSILTVVTLALVLMGALTSQVNTYTNGSVLTASQLNSEFGNIYSTINNLDQANLSASTSIPPSKISATIDGDGISRNGSTGALSVSFDNSTIETASDQIRVKDAGITTAKLASNAVTTAKITDANVTLAKLATSSVDTNKIVDATIATADLANASVTKVKQAVKTAASSTATVGNVAVSSSSGTNTNLTDDANIPNASVTITTNGGPVMLALIPSGADSITGIIGDSADAGGRTDIRIKRSSTTVCLQSFTGSGYKPGAVTCLDVVAAGTYTYTASYATVGSTAAITNIRLVAYEL